MIRRLTRSPLVFSCALFFFFFNDPATTEIYPLPLHDALPICYTYAAENRLISVDGGSTATHSYDALGRRAEKITSAGKYDYIYDLAGKVISEEYINVGGSTGWGVGPIDFNGSLLAEYTLGHSSSYTIFVHKDHLGSTRLVSNLNQSIADNLDYLPYGEQISGASVTTHKFTGDERDSETGLDHTWFRQYSPLLGRWITPDPFAGYIDNPQSLNRYAYVLNNPLRFIDPFGLFTCVYLSDDGDTVESVDSNSSAEECDATGGEEGVPDQSVTVSGDNPPGDPCALPGACTGGGGGNGGSSGGGGGGADPGP